MRRQIIGVSSLIALIGTLTASAMADEASTCHTAFDAAQSLRDRGQLVDALAQTVICLKACTHSPAEEYLAHQCSGFADYISKNQPTIVFGIKDASGGDSQAARVSIDGKLAAEKLDGLPVRIDPGEHTIRFELGSDAPIVQTVVIRMGETNRNLTVSFQKAPRVEVVNPLPPPPQLITTKIPTWAWVAGGAGLALGAVSTVFFVTELGAAPQRDADCLPTSNAACAGETSAVKRDNALGIAFAAAGGAAIVASVIGIVTAPKAVSATARPLLVLPWASAKSGGAAVVATF